VKRIRDDLWESDAESPFAGLTTHAYVWAPPRGGNVLLYSLVRESSVEALSEVGGVVAQYLSHQDEAGPMVGRITERFGSVLHAPSAERRTIAPVAAGEVVWLEGRTTDERGIEVVPTPGHSPGSTCYVVPGIHGERYLFTGDSLFTGADGRWRAGYIPGVSDADQLEASLELLATLEPDLVVSSAFVAPSGVHAVDPRRWPACVAEAKASLPSRSPAR
jgi:hydroxyacylglutathione hydrolase